MKKQILLILALAISSTHGARTKLSERIKRLEAAITRKEAELPKSKMMESKECSCGETVSAPHKELINLYLERHMLQNYENHEILKAPKPRVTARRKQQRVGHHVPRRQSLRQLIQATLEQSKIEK